ncbi:MAG: ImmA/IrrE family metallo-endopeptidase [Eubacteriales bacterium]|nr:ImmA/IrrE family metallo-endopeptidase [Eubacteriales bacterium]
MNYEEMLIEADSEGLIVKEKNIPGYGGRIFKNRIAINRNIETEIEKSCILAEELGHHFTSSGNILDQSVTMNRKQEYRARLYGYDLKIGLDGLIRAARAGCHSLFEVAEFLEVTEEYLMEALSCYRSKYGASVLHNGYEIHFYPQFTISHP